VVHDNVYVSSNYYSCNAALAVYGPLKTCWQDVCHEYLQKHPGRVIMKYNFNEVFPRVGLHHFFLKTLSVGLKYAAFSLSTLEKS